MACIINTYSQKQIDIADPNPDNILIEDIAHALSFICRGCGQVKTFFSVARHCVCCAKEAEARGFSNEVVLACLLHDASEAYMMDLPKPLKDELLPQYRAYENALLDCIYRKFLGRLLTAKEAEQVDIIDHVLLQYDLKYLLNVDTGLPEIHIDLCYNFEPFEKSQKEYLEIYKEYVSRIGQ